MEKIRNPYGIPFLTGFISLQILSRHIAISQSERKFAV